MTQRIAILLAFLAACGGATSEPMTGGDEGDGDAADAGVLPDVDAGSGVSEDGGPPTDGGIPAGAELRAVSDVNLRTGPGTSYGVVLVIPRTGISKAVQDESSGWVRAVYAAREGWTSAHYQEVVPPGSGADDGSTWVARAKMSVGFSYWWGHGRWTTEAGAAPGSCSGTCSNCTHSGSFGADCSGMVAKAWLVPAANWSFSSDAHPYSTLNFYGEETHWKAIPRAEIARGDAMVYRENGSGHVFIYESGDPWGSHIAIECKGCAAGCVRGYRTSGTLYKAIRRDAAVTTARSAGGGLGPD